MTGIVQAPSSSGPDRPVTSAMSARLERLAEIGRTIKQIQWRHHRAGDAALRPSGSTLVQWDTLFAIDREPGATARRLAARTYQTEQSFGAMASRMELSGLIVRESGAGRRLHHHLTEEGRRVLETGVGHWDRILTASIGVLTDQEQDQLLALLERIRDAPEPPPASGPPPIAAPSGAD